MNIKTIKEKIRAHKYYLIAISILIIVMGVIAIIYSYTGGLKSVLWTDFIQGSVLLIGVTFALIFLISYLVLILRFKPQLSPFLSKSKEKKNN